MNESQIRDAGLAIDVPFETAGEPEERLRYADLGKTWTPPEGWPPEYGSTAATGDDTSTATVDPSAAGTVPTPPDMPGEAVPPEPPPEPAA